MHFLILVVALIVGIAFPIWALVDCVQSKKLSPGQKVGWTIGLVVFPGLAAIIYGFRHSKGRPLRLASIVALISTIFLIGLIAKSAMDFSASIMGFSNAIEDSFRDMDMSQLSDTDKDEIKGSVSILRGEFASAGLDLKGREKVYRLLQLLNEFMSDITITLEEFSEWNQFFKSRAILSNEKIGQRAKVAGHVAG